MNNATVVVALMNKCVTPKAKERCERAYQRASNLETTASDLDTLARMEYTNTVKVHRAILSNPNVDQDTVRYLFAHHHPRQFELACGLILNSTLSTWWSKDPKLTWLSTVKLAHLAAVADAMQDYVKYREQADELQRYGRAFAAIVQSRKQEKEEVA